MRPLSQHQLNLIYTLRDYLDHMGAKHGVPLTHAMTAADLGWSEYRVHRVVRLIKEHPELGFTLHVRRGSNPWIVLAADNDLAGSAADESSVINSRGRLEAFWRFARYASQIAQARANSDGRTREGQFIRSEYEKCRGNMFGIQGMLNLSVNRERALSDYINHIFGEGENGDAAFFARRH